MTYSEVHAIVMAVLDEIQISVADTPITINDDTRPIGEIPMFDSILAEDTTVTLLHRLGVVDVGEPANPFIDEGRATQVCDVVRAMAVLVGATEA